MGLTGVGLLLEGCSSLPLLKVSSSSQELIVPTEKFTGQNRLLLVRSAGLENDILLVKKDNSYKALYMKCTHEGVALTVTDKRIVCAAHGSMFDFDGNVVKEPALSPLKEFATRTQNGNVIIQLK